MHQRIIAAAAIALAVTACQKKASGQTVAVVNNDEITASELNAELASANLSPNSATKEARNEALQRLIDRSLLEQQARADGLDKSPQFLNQERRMTQNLLINMFVARHLNTAQVPTPEDISQYEASHPGMFAKREIWTLQQIIYPLPKDAALNAKITAAKTLDDVAQALTAAGVQFTRATRQVDSALFPPDIYQKVVALAPGEPFIVPGPEKAAASAISARQPAPLPDDKARQLALNGIRRDRAEKFAKDRLTSLKGTAKIQYQPGFGPPANKSGF
jgi:EpsD family peptidyl-prolyl cis-trans isomerase